MAGRRQTCLDPGQFINPIAELEREFLRLGSNPLQDLTWAGVSIYYGMLANA